MELCCHQASSQKRKVVTESMMFENLCLLMTIGGILDVENTAVCCMLLVNFLMLSFHD